MRRFLHCLTALISLCAVAPAYAQLGPAPGIGTNSNISNNPSISTGGNAGVSQAIRGSRAYYVEDFEGGVTVVPGTTDETSYFTAAISAAVSAGGSVHLNNRQYYTVSSWTIPQFVSVSGSGNPEGYTSGSNVALNVPMVILGTGATINVAGTLSELAVARQGVNLNIGGNIQSCISNSNSFAGTGVTLVSGKNPTVKHVVFYGHATGISSNGAYDFHLEDIKGDSTNGVVITNMNDVAYLDNVQWFPILSQTCSSVTYAVAAVADDGAGNITVTTSAANALATGNTVTVYNVGGLVGANGRATPITVVDSTHFTYAGGAPSALSATLTTGSNVIGVSSTANLAVGQTFTGTGITGTQTITAVSIPLSEITIANGANVTATGATTLAVVNPTYTSGGSVHLSAGQRFGSCLNISNSTFVTGKGVSCYGYDTPLVLGPSAGWSYLSVSFDADNVPDPGTTAISVSGGGFGNVLDIGYVSSYWTPILVNTASTKSQHFQGGEIYSTAVSGYGPPAFEFLAGSTQLTGNSTQANPGRLYVASGATLYMTGVALPHGAWDFGSVLNGVEMANTAFADFTGNSVRGATISLAVPNASNNAFVQSLVASLNGVRYPLQTTVSAATSACTSSAENLFIEVIDALNPVNGSTVSGGGSTHVWTWCNGSTPTVVTGGSVLALGTTTGTARDAALAITAETAAQTTANLAQMLLFGTGSDGTNTSVGCGSWSSGTITLSRDINCTAQALSGTAVIQTNGYRIYVNGTEDLSAAPTGAFVCSANNSNYFVTTPRGLTGRGSLSGTTGVGTAGAAGYPSGLSGVFGGQTGSSGAGGNGTNAGGAGTSGGASIGTEALFPNPFSFTLATSEGNTTIISVYGGYGGSSGGAGGGDGTNSGGASGPGGYGGCVVYLAALTIQRGTNSNTAIIQAKGVNGSNGSASTAGNTGGGGGGAAGGGGGAYVVGGSFLGSTITNAIDVSGGTGGTGGNGQGTGKGGTGGFAGYGGLAQVLNLSASSFTASAFNTAPATNPTAASTTAGTAGGTPAVVQANL